ncbi:MAG: PAN domain-containing protein [Robiginitomaculum sp.]|nr:PAN domain-containing protein [Robiginitomaculum sp.]
MFRFVFTIFILSIFSFSPNSSSAQMFENNTERAGATYVRGAVNAGGPDRCWSLCADDERCLAWTWERPGVSGPLAMCSLKTAVTPGQYSPCCVSGLSVRLERQIDTGFNPRRITPSYPQSRRVPFYGD